MCPHYIQPPRIAAQLPLDDDKRAYMVRGLDLLWAAKRTTDGEIICKRAGRTEAAAEAIRLGYHFTY